MNYKVKSLVQWAFSVLPGSLHWNRLMQLYVTRTLPVTDEELVQRRRLADRHLAHYSARRGTFPDTVLDIGSGADLSFPIMMGMQGPTVTASDISPLASKSLVDNMLGRLGLPSLEAARVRYINYTPPRLPFPDASFDLVTSTSVLEHVPPDQLPVLLAEIRRVLKPDGITSHHVAHRDHWSGADPDVHFMNYVRYGPREWRRYNPPIMYQNRLLHSQYRSLFDDAGLRFAVEIERTETLPPEIHESFRGFSEEDLTTYHSWFVCEAELAGA
jgi:SAM-dependent methyltransferase